MTAGTGTGSGADEREDEDDMEEEDNVDDVDDDLMGRASSGPVSSILGGGFVLVAEYL